MTSQALETVSILLVDDRPSNLAALEAVLQRPDYRLVKAANGREALTRVLQEDFAVILMDVAMPEMDGFEAASLIKQREKSANIPIIFVTASIYELEQVFHGYSVGAVDYLRKPVESHVVQAKVAVFVQLHRQKKEIERQAELLRGVEQREREALVKRTDEQIHRSEARFDAAFDEAPVGIAEADLDGRFTRVNAELARILGVEPSDVIGRTLASFVPGSDGAALAADRQALLSTGERIMRREHPCLRPDRRMAWVRSTFSVVRDRRNVPQQYVLVLEDVTEQRWTEQTRSFLVDAGRVLLGTLDRDRTLRSVARVAVEGFCDWCTIDLLNEDGVPVTAAGDHADPSLVPFLDRVRAGWPESERALNTALETGEPMLIRDGAGDSAQEGEAAAIVVPLSARSRIFGAITFVSSDGGRVYSESDLHTGIELAHLAALAIDNARLFEEAEAAVHVRDEFLSVAAHELRTPLTPLKLLIGTYQKLLDRGKPDEVMARLPATFRRATRQIDRLVWLVDTLLDVSRIREGKLRIQRENADLAEIARDTADRFEEEAKANGCRIVLDVESAPGFWDGHRLEQVASNLLGNAIKYGAGKEVGVQVRGGDPARLTVIDRGIGIAPDEQQRIFEPFERAVSPLSFGGLGLGLYIARQIVDAHGGHISVHSEPGHTEFTVSLPPQPRPKKRDASRQPEAPA